MGVEGQAVFRPGPTGGLEDLRVGVPVPGESRRLDYPDDLALWEEGAFLELGDASEVFLLQVATENGWNRETFFRRLAHGAGLRPESWTEATLEAFEAAAPSEEGDLSSARDPSA